MQAHIVASMIKAHPYEEVAYDIYPLDNDHPSIGAGVIGELESSMEGREFLLFVKKTMNTACIRHTPFIGKKVEKVAICGGSGSFLLSHAIQNGAQAFITADFKYHQFFDADGKIIIADIGHYESEQFTKNLLYDIVNKNFNFALRLTEVVTNPINYI
jgi:putative NIF3 family GTP cyclohydrolase 1 type 2